MEGLERCYQCGLVPDLKSDKTSGSKKFVFVCLTRGHGHMAMGDTLAMAVQNWNQYITFMRQEMLTGSH